MAVSCSECGLLAIRRVDDRALLEVMDRTRDGGEILAGGTKYEDRLICFVRAHKLERGGNAPGTRRVLLQERDCDERGLFMEWVQGFTPKEHVEMKLLEEQRKAEDERREREESWRREQAERVHQWQMEQTERDREWRREDITLARQDMRTQVVVAIAVALLSAAVTLGAVFLASWLSPPAS